MRRLFLTSILLGLLAACPHRASAQKLQDFNPQFHGYATQSFIYSDQNNWNTTSSTKGSPAWTEGVANLTVQPASRLRLGAQARYFRLGTYGNNVTLDWASAEFKINERLGVRVGKVKSPIGLLNETQDIDPAHLWILLPQVIYPVASRGALLAQYGGLAFGTVYLGRRAGKVDYRAGVGNRRVPSGDGFFDPLRGSGITVPNGLTGLTFGGQLRWKPPLRGLMIGASVDNDRPHGPLALGPYKGTLTTRPVTIPFFFAQYEHSRFMVAGEYRRFAATSRLEIPPLPLIVKSNDQRSFYLMTSYKLSAKLTAGLYYGGQTNRVAPLGSDRYDKDWTLAARYDFNQFLYLKAEQHLLDGTLTGFSASNNQGGLAETSKLSLLKLGVTF